MESQNTLAYHVEKFYTHQTLPRKETIAKRIEKVGRIVSKIMKEVTAKEPRYINSLDETESRLPGLEVISPNEYEVILSLNQMGVFNFMEEEKNPAGYASLKLIEGRKKSMSLWLEFITAAGALSARKLRSRFLSLVAKVVEEMNYGDSITLEETHSNDVQLVIRDRVERLVVRIVPAFRCRNLWPATFADWPNVHRKVWPPLLLVDEVKKAGITLLSKHMDFTMPKAQHSMDGDAWWISFTQAEDVLIGNGSRKKCLSILKTLRDRHLDFRGSPLNNYHIKTLLLYECDKHQFESDWNDSVIGDRIQGILLQLVSCLRYRKLPHYFNPAVDLFANIPSPLLDLTIKQVWRLTREIITNSKNFDNL